MAKKRDVKVRYIRGWQTDWDVENNKSRRHTLSCSFCVRVCVYVLNLSMFFHYTREREQQQRYIFGSTERKSRENLCNMILIYFYKFVFPTVLFLSFVLTLKINFGLTTLPLHCPPPTYLEDGATSRCNHLNFKLVTFHLMHLGLSVFHFALFFFISSRN